MNPYSSSEDAFNAQDDRPFGIQGSDADELARLDALERRQAEAGNDLWGAPLNLSGCPDCLGVVIDGLCQCCLRVVTP